MLKRLPIQIACNGNRNCIMSLSTMPLICIFLGKKNSYIAGPSRWVSESKVLILRKILIIQYSWTEIETITYFRVPSGNFQSELRKLPRIVGSDWNCIMFSEAIAYCRVPPEGIRIETERSKDLLQSSMQPFTLSDKTIHVSESHTWSCNSNYKLNHNLGNNRILTGLS